MDKDADAENIVYANETTMSMSNNDAVITYRWVVPVYNENNEPIGKKIVNEIMVSMPAAMFKENALKATGLIEKLEKIKEVEGNK